ncbi:MAG: ACP S-malonyltransferase [Anaerolineales bacterium]
MPLDPRRTAFVFPGQGSQIVGMGRGLAESKPEAAAAFREADEILGLPLSRICFEGPAGDLDQTEITQPALFTHSIAVLRALQKRHPDLRPACSAGHSLGELSALVAAGSLSFPDGLRLVRARGLAMRDAGAKSAGGMAAVLGLDVEVVEAACRKAASGGAVVQVANDNCPGQVVISGDETGLSAALAVLEARGARKLVRLAVSIAAHSALMGAAEMAFGRALDAAAWSDPQVVIWGNVSATPLRTREEIRADLAAQLTSRVRWTESVRGMIASGITHFIELGPGSVLTGLLRRIDKTATGIPLGDPASFSQLET